MNNIPKAEEFYDKKDINGLPMSFNEKMIEFAKFHVEAALTHVYEKINIEEVQDGIKDSILNVYPLENIK
jgi:hypothetical protein